MPSSFDRSLPISRFDKFDHGKSAWNTHRSIWQDDSAETESSRRTLTTASNKSACLHSAATSVRQNSASSNKFGKTLNGSALSTIENPRNTTSDGNAWCGTNAANNRQAGNFTSPTKRKQSGWLFDSRAHDVENASSLLAGSAPEFEPLGGDGNQDKLMLGRPLRLSDETMAYDARFAPSLRLTGPAQLPAPNRGLSNGLQLNGLAHGNHPVTTGGQGLANASYRGGNDTGLSTHTSPPASRGMATGSVRSNSNTVSPTAPRFARDMSGYLQRNAGALEEASESFRHLDLHKVSPVYEKLGHVYDVSRPIIHNEDDLALLNSSYEAGNYYRSNPYYAHEYIDPQAMPSWNYWGADPKFRPEQASDYRNGPSSPYHSSSLTPSSGTESLRSAVASRNSHHDVLVATRKAGPPDGYYQSSYMNSMLMPHGAIPVEMGARGHMNPLAAPYYMSNYATGPRQLYREEQRPVAARSPLLEEFRIHHKQNTKRYELRDLFGHIVEFSGDRDGSRFIQHKLETANSDDKDQVFKEIQGEALQLMTDIFGNYCIQKLFEHGSQSQKKVLADYMKGRVAYLATQMYGCRVVQKALEHVLSEQQASIVKELDSPNASIIKIIKDQNGNHCVQKAVEWVPAEHIQFIIDAHKGEAVHLAQHTYGCRVIQRILEFCTPAAKRVILDELHGSLGTLITDQFGNYCVQHIVEYGEQSDRRRVVEYVIGQLMNFSKHKFASNVVEKCLAYADEDQRTVMFMILTQPDASGQTPVYGLLRDQYGNYVIRKTPSLSTPSVQQLTLGPQRKSSACWKDISGTSSRAKCAAVSCSSSGPATANRSSRSRSSCTEALSRCRSRMLPTTTNTTAAR